MKVIFVLHSNDAGGAERHLIQLMSGLKNAGVTCIFAGSLDGWLGRQLIAAGFQCENIPFTGIYDLFSLLRLAKLIRREKADLVHGHLTRGALYVGLASRMTGVPNVATAHSTNAGKRFGRADRIIAVSDAVKRFLVECGYRQDLIRTVHHGVPDYATLPRTPEHYMRTELQLDDSPVLVMVARFMPAKGHDVALRALALLKDRQWILVLAGSLDTSCAKDMLALTETLDITDRIRFIGHRDDVINIYGIGDILLAPSRREALSLTLLEAAAFSLPIVATDVGGISEAVADGLTGLLVASEDFTAFAQAIRTLLDNPELRRNMGKAGRQRYEKQFALKSMTQETIRVYDELVGGRAI
jgi:glycosyltransferase involved in cell wall biosynthesis